MELVLNDLLVLGRQAVPPFSGAEHGVPQGLLGQQGNILHQLIGLGGIDQVDGLVQRIDGTGGQGAELLRGSHAHGRRAHGLEALQPRLAVDGAQLQALDGLRGGIGRPANDMAHTSGNGGVQRMDVLLIQVGDNLLAQVGIIEADNLLGRLPDKAGLQGVGLRVLVVPCREGGHGDDGGVGIGSVDPGIGITESVVGIDVDRDHTVGALRDPVGSILQLRVELVQVGISIAQTDGDGIRGRGLGIGRCVRGLSGSFGLAAASGQAHGHHKAQSQCEKLLHTISSLFS